jgi:hypothetical protein
MGRDFHSLQPQALGFTAEDHSLSNRRTQFPALLSACDRRASRSSYRNKMGRNPKLIPAEISLLMKLPPQLGVVQDPGFTACSLAP